MDVEERLVEMNNKRLQKMQGMDLDEDTKNQMVEDLMDRFDTIRSRCSSDEEALSELQGKLGL